MDPISPQARPPCVTSAPDPPVAWVVLSVLIR